MIALVIAGGSGTRLWPLSRKNNPKQLHKIIGDESLITQTIKRLSPLVEAKNTWVVTNKMYAERIAEDIPSIPRNQIITEPFPIGTNLAVGLGLIHVAKYHPDDVVVIGWADSYIGRETEFLKVLKEAEFAAQSSEGVILAVKPTYAATDYGYIQTGIQLSKSPDIYRVQCFEEKPSSFRAAELFGNPSYFWNPGIFVFKISALLELINRYTPEHFAALSYVAEVIGTSEETTRINEAFALLDHVSIDRAIFERANNLVTIPADIEWRDVGSWSAVYDVQAQKDLMNNVTRGSVAAVNTDNCLIYAQNRLIATFGISDLVIVETEDAVLIAHKSDTEGLKELLVAVQNFGDGKYL